jgi:branched-chain amino acid transport system substrate-binding protein
MYRSFLTLARSIAFGSSPVSAPPLPRPVSRLAMIFGLVLPLVTCMTVASAQDNQVGSASSPDQSAERTGITANEVVIGTANGPSGPNAWYAVQNNIGISSYLDSVNASGGVFGRKVRVIFKDDHYEPETAVKCLQELLAEKTFALIGCVGTPVLAKYIPMCASNKVPLINIYSGPEFIENPVKHYVFSCRPPYQEEMHQTVDHLWKDLGIRKIAVIYQNDAYGVDCLRGIEHELKKYGASPVATGSYTRNVNKPEDAIKTVKGANPQAVILAAVTGCCAEVLKLSNQMGWHPIFAINSGSALDKLCPLGKEVENVPVSEVMITPSNKKLPGVASYLAALQKYYPNETPNLVSLKGYVNALIFVEAMKRAGKDLTREKLIQALESMHNMDIGLGKDLLVSYSPKDHLGLHHVFFFTIKNGEIAPLAWKNIALPAH